jgi:hypothetical protein
MPDEGARLKAELMEQAAAAIEELMATRRPAEEISLTEIEQLSLQVGERVREAVLGSLVQASARGEPNGGVRCPECGGRMQRKGERTRQVVTEAGEVRVSRAYYSCPACRRGLFPPG